MDAGDKLSWAKRLWNVIVGAQIEARNGAELIAGRGKENNGDIKLGLDRSAGREAIALRQRHIQQHKIRLFLRKQLHGRRLPGYTSHKITFAVQIFAQARNDNFIVFYQ